MSDAKKERKPLSRGEATSLGIAAMLGGRGALDLRAGKASETAAFARNKANELDLPEAQHRFRTLAETHKQHGVRVNPLNPAMKYVAFSKNKLDESDFLNLGFEPVTVAIPEKGQKRVTSFRHPASNFHIHDHGGDWVMHEDAHAAFPMRRRLKKLSKGSKAVRTPEGRIFKIKKRTSNRQDLIGGLSHIVQEGVPGAVNYVKNQFDEGPGMLAFVNQNMADGGHRMLDSISDKAKSSLSRDLVSARALQHKGKIGLGIGTGIAGIAALRRLRAKRKQEKMKKLSSITYRGHTFDAYNRPKRNDGPGKHKKMVLAKQGDKIRLIRFGHKDYGHNINPKRKANYLKRSAGIRDKNGNLTKDNKLSANYWARKKLWPASKPTLAEKRASFENLEVLVWNLRR